MNYQATFKRHEIKYLITREQKEIILQEMRPYMSMDNYGHATIRNIYFDTDNFRLIRRSIEKPVYKEKLRLRSYQQITPQDNVFLEIKKKYEEIVYKRRETIVYEDLLNWISEGRTFPLNSQIGNEILYFFEHYSIIPKMFISYEREAFYSLDGSDFRVTFDENILARTDNLFLSADAYGKKLISEDGVLMELKTSGGIPLWMVKVLSREKIFKTSFSKYGRAYEEIVMGR